MKLSAKHFEILQNEAQNRYDAKMNEQANFYENSEAILKTNLEEMMAEHIPGATITRIGLGSWNTSIYWAHSSHLEDTFGKEYELRVKGPRYGTDENKFHMEASYGSTGAFCLDGSDEYAAAAIFRGQMNEALMANYSSVLAMVQPFMEQLKAYSKEIYNIEREQTNLKHAFDEHLESQIRENIAEQLDAEISSPIVVMEGVELILGNVAKTGSSASYINLHNQGAEGSIYYKNNKNRINLDEVIQKMAVRVRIRLNEKANEVE